MFAITGASGKLGRCIASALLHRVSASHVRLGTRTPDSLRSAAQITPADFDDRQSLERLFTGARVALVISGTAPHALRVQQHSNAFEAARRAGVERIVYTSFANAGPGSRFSVAASHGESEAALQAIGTNHIILRNNCYAENIMIEAARATGVLAQSGSSGKVAYISYADVAAAAVGAMLESKHKGGIYEITGPEAFDHYEIASVLSMAWGRRVRVEDLSPSDYERTLRVRNIPSEIIDVLTTLHLAMGAGEYERVSADAAVLAGRAIEPVGHFLRRA